MFENDNEIVAQALSMWANHIETGRVTNTATDVINMGLFPKPLTMDQMKFVIRLRELSVKTLEKC